MRSFVITAGRDVLPRQSARPPVAVAQLQTQAGGGPSADPMLTDLTQPEPGSVYGTGQTPAVGTQERAPAPLRPGAQPGWNITDAQETDNQAGGYSRIGQAPAQALQPPNTALLDVPQFDHEQFPQKQAAGGSTRPGATGTQAGAAAANTRPPRYSSRPQSPPSQRIDRGADRLGAAENNWPSEEPETRLAARSTAVPGTTGESLPRRSTGSRSDAGSADKEPEFPVMPFTLSLFALFLSLGGNLYLAWTAAEFYSRYKLAVERLRSASR